MAGDRIKFSAGPRLGLDENGLGPRLGPLIVTATYAELSEQGAVRLRRKLPESMRNDLDDSKAIVSCHDYSIAEAWARVIVERTTGQAKLAPDELLQVLCPVSLIEIKKMCPKSTGRMCFGTSHEEFVSNDEQLSRVRKHLDRFDKMGVDIRAVRSEVVCTGKLNQLKEQGIHRFAADLHAMERLMLALREQADRPIEAVCGKVGGIGKYEPFFGPLSGRLHTALQEGQGLSSYYFPGLGKIHFARDADASDPLVMLASMVGKYLRELLMGRISQFFFDSVEEKYQTPSGYHDPVTAQFVQQTEKQRKKLKIAQDCFERRPANAV